MNTEDRREKERERGEMLESENLAAPSHERTYLAEETAARCSGPIDVLIAPE